MLVLSRGRNDKVVFPTLGITVEILRISGNKVRLGIEAPQEIPVHRHELSERLAASGENNWVIKLPNRQDASMQRLSHAIRNRLNAAALGLHLLHRKLEGDDLSDVEPTIFKIFNELKAIEKELEGEDSSVHSSSAECSTPSRQQQHQCRALVVEDNENERELLAGYLRASGFEVDTAADGLQAMVRLTEKRPPDVVLLDMRMPRFDGRKTIAAIRNNPDYRGLKLFAVSGTRPEEMNVTLGPNGVDRWFVKPIDPQNLLKAMHDVLESDRVLA